MATRKLTIDDVTRYTEQLHGVSERTKALVRKALEGVDLNDAQAVADAIEGALALGTDEAAAVAAEWYDWSRVTETGERFGATAVSGRESGATRTAVQGIVKHAKDEESVLSGILARVGYEIARSAGDCVFDNGSRDPRRPRFARVPTGLETCDFCIMLASRGFVYTSERAAEGYLGHYHDDCDCRVVSSWDAHEVEGYDPEAYYAQWNAGIRAKAERAAEKSGRSVEDEEQRIRTRLAYSGTRSRERRKAKAASGGIGSVSRYMSRAEKAAEAERYLDAVRSAKNKAELLAIGNEAAAFIDSSGLAGSWSTQLRQTARQALRALR